MANMSLYFHHLLVEYATFPEQSGIFKKLYYEILVKRAAQQAEVIFTISEFSRSRILSWLDISADQLIINIGCGVSGNLCRRRCLEPGDPYILLAGNRKAHKNEFRTPVICIFQ